MDSEEHLFLQRIENIGKSNDIHLSDIELRRGKSILSEAQRGTRIPDQAIIQNLRVALAPHRRLPTEILAEIFVQSMEDDFPRDLSISPWALRSVCSRWRIISINEHRLWRRINIASRFNAHDMKWELAFPLPFLIGHLIPSQGSLSISLSAHKAWRAMECLVLPNLPRLTELSLSLDSLSDLLKLLNHPRFQIPETLALRFHIFPFSAVSLELSVSDIAAGRALTTAKKLRKVSLSCAAMQVICRLFLRFDFPWAQLVELDISHFNADLTNIFDMLSRCVCLVKLSLSFFKASSLSQLVGNFPQSGSHHSVTLPYLKHLELSEVPNHIFRPFVVPALTELVMRCDFLPADDIVTMIRRSKCYILELRHRPGNYLHTTTHDLLEAIPHIKEFICAPALIRDEDLRNIGRGFLLPQVEVLHCAVTSPIPYLEMIEAQMALAHRGAEEQGGKLTHAEVQVQENFEEFDKVVERLRQINAENGTFFTLTKT